MKKTLFSWSSLVVFLLTAMLAILYYMNPHSNVIAWDVFGYYLYLPAIFIYGDPALNDLSWVESVIGTYHNTPVFCQAAVLENGNAVLVYNMGLAVMNLPFFLAAHMVALFSDFPADGFSYPYQLAIVMGGQFYMLAGLLFLRKILLHFVTETICCITVVLVVLATNYFQMHTWGLSMPHSYLFAWIACFVWALLKWEAGGKWRFALLMAGAGGMVTLIRPTEFVVFLLFVFWTVAGRQSLRNRWNMMRTRKMQIWLMALVFLLVLFPQFLYWKFITGSWYYYAHPSGVGLDLLSPHIPEVLISFRKGWLIYTPLMVFALAGFWFLFRKAKYAFGAILIYFLVNLYIVSSWSCWWYAGGDFSNRALVSSYAALSIPLAFFVQKALASKWKYPFFAVSLFLVGLNLFQTWQFHAGIIDGERMTLKYYAKVFGRMSVNDSEKQFLLVDRSRSVADSLENMEGYGHRIIGFWDFEEVVAHKKNQYSEDVAFSGTRSFVMDSATQFSPGLSMQYSCITRKDHAWIRAGLYVYIPSGYSEELPLLVTTFVHKKKNYAYKTRAMDEVNIRFDDWNYLQICFMTPEVMNRRDKLYVYVWHRGKARVFADDLKVEAFEPL